MANLIQLRRSAVQGAVPTTAQLALGELAINTYDGKLYLKKNVSGTETVVEIGGSGNTTTTISATPPASPTVGSLWWDSNEGKLKIYYNDGTSSQWVDASSNTYGSGGTTLSSTDGLSEGTTNLYFTTARARASISATQNVTYNSSTGVITGPDLSGYLLSSTASSTYQPLDADLTSIAGLAGTSGFLKKTAANTWSLDTNTYLTGNQSITLSGDASGTGSTAITVTLANTAVTAGNYTNANITVDSKGRITAASNGSVGVTSITAGTGLSGGTITTTGTIALADTAVTAGNYTNANITVDAQGRITAASNGSAGGTPAGSTTQIQFNNSGSFGASADFTFDDTNDTVTLGGTNPQINLKASTSFPATASGTLSYIAEDMAGRMMPCFLGPDQDGSIQPHIARNRIYYWAPAGNNTTTTPNFLPGPGLSSIGTATARAFATTNILTRAARLGYLGTTTTASGVGIRTGVLPLTTGTGTGLGGFTMILRFAVSDAAAVSGARMFAGMTSTASTLSNVEYSTLTNSIGVAQLSTDATQWYLVYGGSSAQTPIALGTSLGAPTLTNTIWEFILFSPHNLNSVVGYQLKNMSTGTIVKGTITPGTPGVQTPASTTAIGAQVYRTNNATALAVAIDFISLYIELDQ